MGFSMFPDCLEKYCVFLLLMLLFEGSHALFKQMVHNLHRRVDPFQNQIVVPECCLVFLCEVIYIEGAFFTGICSQYF